MRICPECKASIDKMCDECGVFFDEPEYIVTDLYNYNQRHQRCYKREDHFKEVLYQFQGKEGKDITPEVLKTIKDQVNDITTLNITEVRQILRRLKMTKYVENAFYITFALSGEQPPYIPKDVEDKVTRMFSRIITAYSNIDAKKRKSFPNYYFILFKLLELMGQTSLLARVPLLQTRSRIKQHDHLWEQLCSELDWKFIPTQISA